MTTFRPFDDGRLALCDDCRCLLPPHETGEHERWHAQIAAPVPAERPDSGSGGSRTGESVDGTPEGWQPLEGAPWMEWRRESRTVRFRKALEAGHPLGKVIGVVRERGTEHYKSDAAVLQRIRDAVDGPRPETGEARGHTPHRSDEMCATMPCPEAGLGSITGSMLHSARSVRLVFAPELRADLDEQIDEFGKRLAGRIRAEMGLAEDDELAKPVKASEAIGEALRKAERETKSAKGGRI